ncbi:cytochrome P450 [Cryphonectria parasitica EP155]|uniref:Cytochrome P450 n=1 Tax=Cryphonectria parasitica (strain ATCC 38755 / EP155) TaxID=660469 RepID=A0A9P4Y934_CRYP1|nr:cytochrome P450 [Cryphonectria parasitica EP155]KAF3769021.1 cytochrome P450 [Cryphonectria parasitica EP155]
MQATKEELAASFAAGVFLHLAVFRSGEWDAHSFTLLEVGAALQLVLSFFAHELFSEPAVDALQHGLYWAGAALAGLYASILVYRAFFHRLGRFPGPFTARLSTFYMTWTSFRRGQVYQDVRRLHTKYGDFVRVGPTELSIADPAAFAVVHSATSQCERGPWYNVLNPTISLQMVRDRREHAQRRKAWDRAFSNKARVAGYTDELLGVFDREKGKRLNASTWFNYYSFDIMGDLAFGRSFDLMKTGVDQYFYKTTHTNMFLIGLFSRMTWLFPIFKATLGRWEYQKFQRFVKGVNEPAVPDVFHWILKEFNQKPKPTWQELQNLYGDCALIVVAGSDTTAATLTGLFYNLATHPDVYKKLQAEVDAFFTAKDGTSNTQGDFDSSSLGKLEYLQACIDESLRLFPPVPSGLQRQTPPQGVQVGETFIPGNTIVMTPAYTIYRDPRTFTHGDEFIPERWTTKPELVKDATAYAPFSVGRFSCVGKQLALMEVRRVTTLIARRYDVAFAPGQTKEDFLAGLRDNFTLATPKLDLVFSQRI